VRRHLWLVGWLGACAVVLIALDAWQRRAYVDYSDGVYALSAHLLLHGHTPYKDFAAAQMPLLYYAGAGMLALGDSIDALRRSMALVDLVLAALTLVAVYRLTGRRLAAALGGVASLIVPWALLEHAQLLPETFAAPLLVASMLAASRRRTSWLAGLAGAVAAFFKVAFLVPSAAIVATAASPLAAAGGLLGTLAGGAVASLLVFGSGFWHEAFQAQAQSGLHSVHYTAGLWVQAAWNLLPLGVPAVIAARKRAAARDETLCRVVIAGSLGSLLLLLSLLKQGSYLDVLVVIEPPLLILAVCGWTWILSERTTDARRRNVIVSAIALALGVIQVGSLLSSPTDPALFGRPFAASPPSWVLTTGQVDREVVLIKRCPATIAYSGPPYLALAADRRVPGNQPDQFIIGHAAADRRFLIAAARDQPRCP